MPENVPNPQVPIHPNDHHPNLRNQPLTQKRLLEVELDLQVWNSSNMDRHRRLQRHQHHARQHPSG